MQHGGALDFSLNGMMLSSLDEQQRPRLLLPLLLPLLLLVAIASARLQLSHPALLSFRQHLLFGL